MGTSSAQLRFLPIRYGILKNKNRKPLTQGFHVVIKLVAGLQFVLFAENQRHFGGVRVGRVDNIVYLCYAPQSMAIGRSLMQCAAHGYRVHIYSRRSISPNRTGLQSPSSSIRPDGFYTYIGCDII